MQQTPVNEVCNLDVLSYMLEGYSKVVEVGSSSGVLARAYRASNTACEYVGVEVDAEYARLSERYCSRVVFGNVEALPSDVFDTLSDAQCWVFADALEHLYDPWKILSKIAQLSSGSVDIVACIPNAQYWGLQLILNSGNYFYQNSGLLDRTHIRWFTRITIIDMFRRAGFEVLEMKARLLSKPSAQVEDALSALARAAGHDSEQAVTDALAFQYVVRASLRR